jgi:hypothetical protein
MFVRPSFVALRAYRNFLHYRVDWYTDKNPLLNFVWYPFHNPDMAHS